MRLTVVMSLQPWQTCAIVTMTSCRRWSVQARTKPYAWGKRGNRISLVPAARRRVAHRAPVPWRFRSVREGALVAVCSKASLKPEPAPRPALPEDTFVREWALLAVRNLCEMSTDAQAAIRCAFPSMQTAFATYNTMQFAGTLTRSASRRWMAQTSAALSRQRKNGTALFTQRNITLNPRQTGRKLTCPTPVAPCCQRMWYQVVGMHKVTQGQAFAP